MSFRALAISMTFLFMVSACFESPVSITSPPSEKVDNTLLGYWVSKSHSPTEPPLKLVIMPFDQNQYLLTWQDGTEIFNARGFASILNGQQYMNIQNVMSTDPKERTFVYFQFSLPSPKSLSVKMISSDTASLKDKTFSTSQQLAQTLTNTKKSDIKFEDPILFERTPAFKFEAVKEKPSK